MGEDGREINSAFGMSSFGRRSLNLGTMAKRGTADPKKQIRV
jgi:hypothetical protein